MNVVLVFVQVLHPKNPFAPTLHFNYRYFETDAPPGMIREAVDEVDYLVVSLVVIIVLDNAKSDYLQLAKAYRNVNFRKIE